MTIPLGHSTFFLTGYDKRSPIPAEDHGVHGMELRFMYRGKAGAVQFTMATDWIPWLPRPEQNSIGVARYRASERTSGLYPMGCDLGYHSVKRPEYYTKADQRNCDFLPRGRCYYDGSGLNADTMLVQFIYDGEKAMRAALEGYYRFQFEGGEWPL